MIVKNFPTEQDIMKYLKDIADDIPCLLSIQLAGLTRMYELENDPDDCV